MQYFLLFITIIILSIYLKNSPSNGIGHYVLYLLVTILVVLTLKALRIHSNL